MIIELLKNDGYSFLKSSSIIWIDAHEPATAKSRHEKSSWTTQSEYTHANSINKTTNRYTDSANTSISSSEDGNIMTYNSDERFSSHIDSHVSWVVASPQDVHNEVTRLFQKHRNNSNASEDTTDPTLPRTQQGQHQELEALHHAITAAIDTSSLVEAIRNSPSPDSSSPLSPTPSLLSLLKDPTLDQREQQQHSSPPFFLSLPASLSETETTVEEPYVTTITARTGADASTSPVMKCQSRANTSSTTTTTHARKLFERHLGSTLSPTSSPMLSPMSSPTGSPKLSSNEKETCSNNHCSKTSGLPTDGVLWSKGTRKISLLDDMSNSLVPISSYSLFPNAENDAFGESSTLGANPPKASNATTVATITESSRTIGYTEQQIGHLTILRPIVLLPRIHSCGSTDNAVAI